MLTRAEGHSNTLKKAEYNQQKVNLYLTGFVQGNTASFAEHPYLNKEMLVQR